MGADYPILQSNEFQKRPELLVLHQETLAKRLFQVHFQVRLLQPMIVMDVGDPASLLTS